MAETAYAQPRRLLIATDLAPRSDRAVDRAVRLAREFGAELVAAHVMAPEDGEPERNWRRSRQWSPDPVGYMRWRLDRDLAAAAANIRPVVEVGDPAEKLAEIAVREACDLIVTGDARPDSLARMVFGSTITRIVRNTDIPVLMVRDRPRRAYRQIVVASDGSADAVQALHAAAALFPNGGFTLFHAFDLPYASQIGRDDIAREQREKEAELAQTIGRDPVLPEAVKARTAVVVERGAPEVLLGAYVGDRDVDLTVVGSRGRGAVFDVLIGSTAKRLVESLEGDLLIVRCADRV